MFAPAEAGAFSLFFFFIWKVLLIGFQFLCWKRVYLLLYAAHAAAEQ